MTKQEALDKLHELALKTEDENLKKQLQLIDVALLPDPNYFVIPEFKERCQTILNYYGVESQIVQTSQELSELNIELTKYVVDTINCEKEKILDELGDVYIMLQQIKLSFNISENEVGRKIDEKLIKTINRIPMQQS